MQTALKCSSTPNSGTEFLRDEYSVMCSLKLSRKPVVALAHGYAMGAVSLFFVPINSYVLINITSNIVIFGLSGLTFFLRELEGEACKPSYTPKMIKKRERVGSDYRPE